MFAHDLRQLRRQAGLPSYRVLAGSSHFSATALSKAASGRLLPSLDVTLAYVRACGGEPTSWRRRWQDLCATTAPPPDPESEPEPVPEPEPEPTLGTGLPADRPTVRRYALPALAVTAAVAAVLAVVGWVAGPARPSRTAGPPTASPDPRAAPARDGADPYAQRCGADQQELERQPIAWPDGGRYGWLVLFHSRACAASWGYVYGPNSPSWRVSITARRTTDGASAPFSFRGDAAPNSWGNVLSTRPGPVRVEAWVATGPDTHPDPGPRTNTAYWQP